MRRLVSGEKRSGIMHRGSIVVDTADVGVTNGLLPGGLRYRADSDLQVAQCSCRDGFLSYWDKL